MRFYNLFEHIIVGKIIKMINTIFYLLPITTRWHKCVSTLELVEVTFGKVVVVCCCRTHYFCNMSEIIVRARLEAKNNNNNFYLFFTEAEFDDFFGNEDAPFGSYLSCKIPKGSGNRKKKETKFAYLKFKGTESASGRIHIINGKNVSSI